MYSVGNSPLLSLADVAAMLNIKDEAAAKRWLESNRIPIHTICKKKQAFRFDVDVILGIEHAKGLKKEFSSSWQDRYRLSQPNPAIAELVLKELIDSSFYQPTTKIKPLTESDNKIINKFKKR